MGALRVWGSSPPAPLRGEAVAFAGPQAHLPAQLVQMAITGVLRLTFSWPSLQNQQCIDTDVKCCWLPSWVKPISCIVPADSQFQECHAMPCHDCGAFQSHESLLIVDGRCLSPMGRTTFWLNQTCLMLPFWVS